MKQRRGRDLLENAYSQLAVNIYADHKKTNRKAYGICGCNHGVGVTETAVHLAELLANAGWKTVLINVNFHQTTERPAVVEKEIGKGIADLILGKEELDSIIAKTRIKNLDYISSGSASEKNAGKILCSARFAGAINQIKPRYDFVILDTYPILEGPDAKIVCSEADGAVLVAAIGETTKDALEKAKLSLEKSDINVLGIVVTKVKKADISRRRKEGKKKICI